MESTWFNPKQSLIDLYNLPHNKFGLAASLAQDELFVSQQKIREISEFVGDRARKKDFLGPKLFIRADYLDSVQSDKNWWLDAESILHLNDEMQDFENLDLTLYVEEITALCRDYFAEFGHIHRITTLALPRNESIIGIIQSPLLGRFVPALQECVEKIYFPITKSEWLEDHSQF